METGTTFQLPPSPAPQLLLFSLPFLVLSEHRMRSYGGTVIFKMLSSAAFLVGPLLTTSSGWSPYRRAITVGLLFSLIGDYFLLPNHKDFPQEQSQKDVTGKRDQNQDISISFQAGVVAFAAAHIAYIYAFLQTAQTIGWPTFITTFAATIVFAKWLGVIYPPTSSSLASNFLGLRISRDMKPLVVIYALIISSMFAVATSVSNSFEISQRAAGAAMFVVSDVFVAASAFGTTSVGSRGLVRIAVGYGLYFWGQMVIAGTVEGQ
ncbi:lysoplasmalogenase [Aspergillus foveolatus]|uniref:lysoplasmalogenase n=1 Tax=Aspergillus foveolatus TaxID=210207 RepID=UPI003CCE2297